MGFQGQDFCQVAGFGYHGFRARNPWHPDNDSDPKVRQENDGIPQPPPIWEGPRKKIRAEKEESQNESAAALDGV